MKIGKPNQSGGAGGGFVKEEHVDHLLAFVGVTHEAEMQTRFGVQEAARVETFICLDCMTLANDVLVFGTALVPRLIGTELDVVLGRLEQGEASAGKSAPWLLEDPTDLDEKRAAEFFDTYGTTLRSGRIVVEMPTSEDPDKF